MRLHIMYAVLIVHMLVAFFFFFQAEDGIRDHCVTGVQTCALPILLTVSEKGYGKRTLLAEYRITSRGGKGVVNMKTTRSEEHTSELQSHSDLVCRLLLEKKKRITSRTLHNSTEPSRTSMAAWTSPR